MLPLHNCILHMNGCYFVEENTTSLENKDSHFQLTFLKFCYTKYRKTLAQTETKEIGTGNVFT